MNKVKHAKLSRAIHQALVSSARESGADIGLALSALGAVQAFLIGGIQDEATRNKFLVGVIATLPERVEAQIRAGQVAETSLAAPTTQPTEV